METSPFRRAYQALERFGAAMFRRMDNFYLTFWHASRGVRRRDDGLPDHVWPVTPGAYVVGNPQAAIAVCTLTSNELMRPIAMLPGVAIAGRLYTCNMGIEKIVSNVCANASIRVLLLCGRDSVLFKQAQSLRALMENGITPDKHIVGAQGYLPVLGGIDPNAVEQFRRQIMLVDRIGETDVDEIGAEVKRLVQEFPPESSAMPASVPVRNVPSSAQAQDEVEGDDSRFVVLSPGGKREPLSYDPKGYFVITLERANDRIVARHYLPDATPAHSMRGRSGEGMLLAFIHEGLVTQMSHAGYLGGELAKAESALRLGLEYEQDKQLGAAPQAP
ncbi:MAG: hypothetical protein GIW99_07360 [Candidatus Eremiobacteraeota bacterium]|nr:hypothetical protein [Candidatus Eremiobacteraeota bacterium]MBC5827481.1 hypothetical protein [Candidatus Eremiobacteraeota bacterium]